MRIISGDLKGKKIFEPIDNKTRPLKDLVKESIFNIINHSNKLNISCKDKNILDLFSGTGSFGLEALSRGASKTTFVENYPPAINILKKNILKLDLTNKCKVVEKDILKDLFFEKINQKFDIIFLDPPFNEMEISLILNKILKFGILNEKGIIILHRNNKTKESFLKEFNIIEEKKYGISKIIFGNYF